MKSVHAQKDKELVLVIRVEAEVVVVIEELKVFIEILPVKEDVELKLFIVIVLVEDVVLMILVVVEAVKVVLIQVGSQSQSFEHVILIQTAFPHPIQLLFPHCIAQLI